MGLANHTGNVVWPGVPRGAHGSAWLHPVPIWLWVKNRGTLADQATKEVNLPGFRAICLLLICRLNGLLAGNVGFRGVFAGPLWSF